MVGGCFAGADFGRRFKTAETEFERRIEFGARKIDRVFVAADGGFFDRRAARIIQAQQQRGFVERLPGGVVAGFAEQAVIARRARMPQLRVSARSEQREIFARLVRRDKIRIRIRIREAQKRRQNVRFEMIDGDGRQPPTASERVGQRAAREQGGGEPRPGRVSDGGGDFARPRQAIRIAQHRIDHRQQAAQMIARGDFRHHAAEARMACGLRKHARIRNPAVGENQRASGFVAGGLDPQNRQGGGHFLIIARREIAPASESVLIQ